MYAVFTCVLPTTVSLPAVGVDEPDDDFSAGVLHDQILVRPRGVVKAIDVPLLAGKPDSNSLARSRGQWGAVALEPTVPTTLNLAPARCRCQRCRLPAA